MLSGLFARLRALVRRDGTDRELDDELRFHLDADIAKHIARGLSPADAERAARREFGNLTVAADAAREEWRWPSLESLAQDFRQALRSLRRSLGTTTVAIVTLAVGIALVSTVFSFVNSAFYRPLPYPTADRIVALTTVGRDRIFRWSSQPMEVVDAVRQRARSFDRVSAFTEDRGSTILTGSGEPMSVGVTTVDTGMLPMLSVHAQKGHVFTTREIAEHAPVAIISDALWRSRFGGDDGAIGRSLTLNATTYEIVGVLPPGVRLYERSDVILPLSERPDSVGPEDGERYSLLGRLRPGATIEAARTEFKAIGASLSAGDARFRKWMFFVEEGMFDRGANRGIQLYVWMFVAAAVCVLLVACANVTNLLQIRAAERRVDLAVRASLGASRSRLVRQALIESLVLGAVAGVAGVVLTVWGCKLTAALLPLQNFPSWVRWGVDVNVLAFAVLLTLLVVAAVGIKPALDSTRFDLVRSLKVGGDSFDSNRRVVRSGRNSIVLQIAVSVTLFVAAAMVWHSYANALAVDPGYQADRVLRTSIMLNPSRYTDQASIVRFHRDLADRIAADPRVQSVSVGGNAYRLAADDSAVERASAQARAGQRAPARELSREDAGGVFLPSDPTRSADRDLRPQEERWAVSDTYFGVLGLPVKRGRTFDVSVQSGSAPVAVVSEAFATLLWRERDPIGQTFKIGKAGTQITVIGVVGDVRQVMSGRDAGTHAEARPALYLSERQSTPYNTMVLVRPKGDLAPVAAAMRAAASAIDAEVVPRTETLAREAALENTMYRVLGGILGAFALGALFLAVIGTYGVIAYGVTRRTREIGIRLALGGTSQQILRLFVRDGAAVIAHGLVIGLLLALVATQLLRRLLLGVSPFDPLSYGLVLVFFGGVALAASYLPARRVTRVEPISALRSE